MTSPGQIAPGHAERPPGVADGLTIRIDASLDGLRLVDVGWARLGVVRRRGIGPLIARGGLLLDDAVAGVNEQVSEGQRVQLLPAALLALQDAGDVTPAAPGALDVVHEDDHVVVVDKPAGLHVHPMGRFRDDTLLGRVLWRAGARPGRPWTRYRPSPAHRLDRPTSGLVVFARDVTARAWLQAAMERGEIRRTYTALVHGAPAGHAGLIDVPLGSDPRDRGRRVATRPGGGGQVARTRWRLVERRGDLSLLELELETGRTHQIRAHLAHVGTPIVGDVSYGAPPDGPPPDPRVGHAIALRAVRVTMPSADGGLPLTVDVAARRRTTVVEG